jgi:hypothetical protein
MPLTKIQSLGITDGTIVNADINASAAIAGTKLSGAGKVLQVVQTVKTSLFSSSSSSYTDVTGASVSITPSSASNKILILINGEYSGGDDSFGYLKVLRDSTDLSVGDLRGSEQRATMSAALRTGGGASTNITRAFGCNILDTPSSTSSVTYKLQLKATNSSTIVIGGSSSTSDGNRSSVPTFLTVMEIAA